jgi:hypothetical protein
MFFQNKFFTQNFEPSKCKGLLEKQNFSVSLKYNIYKYGGIMKKLITIFAVTFLFISSNSFAQFSVGGGMGATFFLNDDVTKSISEGGYGLGTEFHYGAKLRFGIPLTPFSIVGGAYWTNMKSDGTYEGYSVEYDQTMFVFSGGAEMTLMPGPIKPFIAADLLYTKINDGELTVSGGGTSTTSTVEGDTRTGLGFGAGVKFTLLPIIDVELVAKYNMHNLWGKEDDEDSFNTYTITANILF